MKRKVSLFFLLMSLIIGNSLFAQQKNLGILLSNNVTSFPVTGYPRVFYSQFHPGLDIFAALKINKKEKNQFWLLANVGGYYHRFVQTAIKSYVTLSYQNIINSRLNFFAGFGGGYLHSIETEATLIMNDEGVYETKNKIIGRPQMLMALDFGISYALKKDDIRSLRLQANMRTYIQGPFVKGYVPFLPVNNFSVGISKPIFPKRKTINN